MINTNTPREVGRESLEQQASPKQQLETLSGKADMQKMKQNEQDPEAKEGASKMLDLLENFSKNFENLRTMIARTFGSQMLEMFSSKLDANSPFKGLLVELSYSNESLLKDIEKNANKKLTASPEDTKNFPQVQASLKEINSPERQAEKIPAMVASEFAARMAANLPKNSATFTSKDLVKAAQLVAEQEKQNLAKKIAQKESADKKDKDKKA
jgi:hypothetical protein